MTLEKKSKISLKQWVTTIRRYEYELPRLYEKLEYLQVKSIGYNSPSFEPKFGGRGASNNYSIDYWLERIEACESQINKRKKEVDKFNEFTSKLDEVSKEQTKTHLVCEAIADKEKLSVTDDEVTKQIETMVSTYQAKDAAALREQFKTNYGVDLDQYVKTMKLQEKVETFMKKSVKIKE